MGVIPWEFKDFLISLGLAPVNLVSWRNEILVPDIFTKNQGYSI